MNDQNKSLIKIEELLKQLLALQLYQAGANQQQIAKHLKVSKTTVNELLKGVKKGTRQLEELGSQNSR